MEVSDYSLYLKKIYIKIWISYSTDTNTVRSKKKGSESSRPMLSYQDNISTDIGQITPRNIPGDEDKEASQKPDFKYQRSASIIIESSKPKGILKKRGQMTPTSINCTKNSFTSVSAQRGYPFSEKRVDYQQEGVTIVEKKVEAKEEVEIVKRSAVNMIYTKSPDFGTKRSTFLGDATLKKEAVYDEEGSINGIRASISQISEISEFTLPHNQNSGKMIQCSRRDKEAILNIQTPNLKNSEIVEIRELTSIKQKVIIYPLIITVMILKIGSNKKGEQQEEVQLKISCIEDEKNELFEIDLQRTSPIIRATSMNSQQYFGNNRKKGFGEVYFDSMQMFKGSENREDKFQKNYEGDKEYRGDNSEERS